MLLDIVFIHNRNKLSGKLTKLFTGSYIYHVGFVTEDREYLYDMNLMHRSVLFKDHYNPESVLVVDCPVPITEDEILRRIAQLNGEASVRNPFYSFLDYCGFALRPIYHFFGKSTPNFGGDICSEWVNNELTENGWKSTYKHTDIPSPTDLYQQLTDYMVSKQMLTHKVMLEWDSKVGYKRKSTRSSLHGNQ